jgi:hypothetical protein
MASLFAILSAPVRMHDGAFAIVVASAAGIEVKTFATAKAARRHYRILLAGLQMAAELLALSPDSRRDTAIIVSRYRSGGRSHKPIATNDCQLQYNISKEPRRAALLIPPGEFGTHEVRRGR